MRTYIVDELSPDDVAKVAEKLTRDGLAASVEGLFWLPVAEDLSEVQAEHADNCGPFAMALECELTAIRLELLVRSREIIRCDCVAYASPKQRETAIETLDTLLRELDISV